MKSISCFIIVAVFTCTTAFKPVSSNNTAKVLAAFNETFKAVENVKWTVKEQYYTAYFVNKNVYTSITYDKEGKFVRSRRTFNEESLPLNILTKLKEKYPGREIYLATEIVEGDDILYSISLHDNVTAWVLRVTITGSITVEKKFKRQLPNDDKIVS